MPFTRRYDSTLTMPESLTFSIIHPSRSRPEESFGCISKWIARAGKEVEVIVSIDSDDVHKDAYKTYYSRPVKVVESDNRSAVDAVNVAAQESTGQILIVVSDDFDCPKNWALILEKHLRGRKDFVLKVYDGIQKYIVTLPILDRAYYNRFGYIYHPDYRHMFVDTHFTHVADVLRRLVFKNDILFEHWHYSNPKKKRRKDELSERADKTWNDGKATYLRHVKDRFGLGKNADIWQLSPEGQGHKEWMKRNGVMVIG